jgi:hypothetical protein
VLVLVLVLIAYACTAAPGPVELEAGRKIEWMGWLDFHQGRMRLKDQVPLHSLRNNFPMTVLQSGAG